MSNFRHSLRCTKLYNKDKNKRKFQSFVNFTKKINDNDFSGFTFYKKALQYLSSTFHYFQIC